MAGEFIGKRFKQLIPHLPEPIAGYLEDYPMRKTG
jgi:hypothetical protein